MYRGVMIVVMDLGVIFRNLLANLRLNRGVDFKVNTNDLLASADQIESKAAEMIAEFEQISSVVSGTAGYWEGDKGDHQRNDFVSVSGDIVAALQRIRTYSETLKRIAGKYETTEKTNLEEANSLPDDIIS